QTSPVLNSFGGQSTSLPLQNSARSQTPAESRHIFVSLGTRGPSSGQTGLMPSHFSGRSHAPCASRHTKPRGRLLSGQFAAEPVQKSWTSQPSASLKEPHFCVFGANRSVGQKKLFPSQASAMSHPPATAGRHTVPAVAGSLSGQSLLALSQNSGLSQSLCFA